MLRRGALQIVKQIEHLDEKYALCRLGSLENVQIQLFSGYGIVMEEQMLFAATESHTARH